MERKKWTAQGHVTEEGLKFREKRKWQVALRRYVIEKNKSPFYAFYFGLDIQSFRNWIECQFSDHLNWENFGTAWQFEHVLPVSYFDFSIEEELKLCWNFINIRVGCIGYDIETTNQVDIIAVKPYFEMLYSKTGYHLCPDFIKKIDAIIATSVTNEPGIEQFLSQKRAHLDIIASLTSEEFNSLNAGISPQDILLEREILKKFG